jgi:hypothetical protein
MLVDRNDMGEPSQITKWVLAGVMIGALLVLITQVVTKCMP